MKADDWTFEFDWTVLSWIQVVVFNLDTFAFTVHAVNCWHFFQKFYLQLFYFHTYTYSCIRRYTCKYFMDMWFFALDFLLLTLAYSEKKKARLTCHTYTSILHSLIPKLNNGLHFCHFCMHIYIFFFLEYGCMHIFHLHKLIKMFFIIPLLTEKAFHKRMNVSRVKQWK